MLPLRLIIEHKLYWAAFSNPSEAQFVTAVLNSATVNEMIKPFQSTGLLGERDIEKKVLDVPIPLYDSSNAIHHKLSELGQEAHKKAQAVISDPNFPAGASLARQRAFIRTAMADIFVEIDGLVRKLLRLE